jgi:hypothetical protein
VVVAVVDPLDRVVVVVRRIRHSRRLVDHTLVSWISMLRFV